MDLSKEVDRVSTELRTTQNNLSSEGTRLIELESNSQNTDEDEELAMEMKSRIRSYERKISELEGDLANAQRELRKKQTEYKKAYKHLPESPRHPEPKKTKETIALESQLNDVQKERANLREELGSLQEKLDKLTEEMQLMNSEKLELVEKIDAIKQEHEALVLSSSEIKLENAKLDDSVSDLENLNSQMKTSHAEAIKLLEDKVVELENKWTEAALENQELRSDLDDNKRVPLKEIQELENDVDCLMKEKRIKEEELLKNSQDIKNLKSELKVAEDEKLKLEDQLKENNNEKRCLKERLEVLETRLLAASESSESKLEQAYKDLDQANSKLQDLLSEADEKQHEIEKLTQEQMTQKKLFDKELSTSNKQISDLKQQMADEEEECDNLMKENRQMKQNISQKDEEIMELQHDIQEAKQKLERNSERNDSDKHALERTIEKMKADQKELYSDIEEHKQRISTLETTNSHLRSEIQRKTEVQQQTESLLSQKSTNQDSAFQSLLQRVEDSDNQVLNLRKELNESKSSLEAAKIEVQLVPTLRLQVQQGREEICKLSEEINEERKNRIASQQGIEELKKQLKLTQGREQDLERRNQELQRMLLDLERQLEDMRNKAIKDREQNNQVTSEEEKLENDFEILKQQLIFVTDRHDKQLQRYNERKLRTKNKLHEAREHFNLEKSKLEAQISKLQLDLASCQQDLSHEKEWKTQLDGDYKKVINEKRQLLAQLAEQEEAVKDKSRAASILEIRCKFLEEENASVKFRMDSLASSKQQLDKLVKDLQCQTKGNIDSPKSPMLMSSTPRRSSQHFRATSYDSSLNSSHHDNTSDLSSTDLYSGLLSPRPQTTPITVLTVPSSGPMTSPRHMPSPRHMSSTVQHGWNSSPSYFDVNSQNVFFSPENADFLNRLKNLDIMLDIHKKNASTDIVFNKK